ncbi:MAG: MBL fold metallo-hydrolase [Clostridia bacterium]|nr:MBL fold metallo-hydrolase [Clostridia bacterium]
MRSSIRKTRNIIAVVLAAAILIISITGYLIDLYRKTKDWLFGTPAAYNGAYVEMLDVGQGDCILLVSGGKAALIDTGIKTKFSAVKEELKDKNINSLDVLIITHNHTDHMGSVDMLTKAYPVKTFIIPDLNKTDERTDKMQEAIENVKKSGGECITAARGTEVSVGEFTLTVVGAYYDEKDENDRSIITLAKIGKWKFLFTGDAQESAENRLMQDNPYLKCDVLKVGHHGSMYSSTEEFLEATSPTLAMISCGKGNKYSHPHDVVLLRLRQAGVQFWRTDTNGNITFDITEQEITVKTEKES